MDKTLFSLGGLPVTGLGLLLAACALALALLIIIAVSVLRANGARAIGPQHGHRDDDQQGQRQRAGREQKAEAGDGKAAEGEEGLVHRLDNNPTCGKLEQRGNKNFRALTQPLRPRPHAPQKVLRLHGRLARALDFDQPQGARAAGDGQLIAQQGAGGA